MGRTPCAPLHRPARLYYNDTVMPVHYAHALQLRLAGGRTLPVCYRT